AQYLATVEGSRLVVTNLVASVASAYFELLALDRTLDVLTQTVARQREALDVVKLQKEAGRANELAVQQFEAQLADTSALKAAAELRVKQTEGIINLLRGTYPQPVRRTREGLHAPVASNVATGVPSDLLRNRPDIREAEQQLRATKCDLRAARAAFYPSINISAGAGFEAFSPKFLFSTPASVAYSATLGLVAPLVNRSAIEAEFNAAKALQIEAMYNYQRTILTAYVEVANGLAALQSNTAIVELKQQQRTAVEQTVATADTLFRAGKASYFEVLMAQQNTLSADLELIESMRDHHVASVDVYRALGGGWRD
ncbi:MAG: TolC family protein, partial [Chloroflexi bacterium]|nr:TolC family protein [Chloroflexota bacterium]